MQREVIAFCSLLLREVQYKRNGCDPVWEPVEELLIGVVVAQIHVQPKDEVTNGLYRISQGSLSCLSSSLLLRSLKAALESQSSFFFKSKSLWLAEKCWAYH